MRSKVILLLGIFLFPYLNLATAQEKIKRENIEWLDVWQPEYNQTGLPRVLLIGNSITRMYFKGVEQQLKGKAFVSRISTSKSLGDPGLLKEIELVSADQKFDIIHFNNGMHGWEYSEDEYIKAFPALLQLIRKQSPQAKLIWANTTPVRSGEEMAGFGSRNDRVIKRNALVSEFLENENVQINDLYSLMAGNKALYSKGDGVHPSSLGVQVLANQVSDQIRQALGEYPGLDSFPAGFTPKEVGAKLAYHFIPSKHFLHGGKWIHYAEVCTWLGALRFAQTLGDTVLIRRLKERFEPLFSSEKSFLPIMNHVDLNMFGSLPLEFYKATKDKRYFGLGIPYADTQWSVPKDAGSEERAMAKQGFSWQTRLWIDDMFMITIIQSMAYRVTGEVKYINRAAKEMVYYLDKLQRPNGLFYHAPDVPFFWARGNGWMAAGMAELLKALPAKNPDRNRILESYKKMMSSLKEFQGKDGMWKQLIDQPDFWPETSGSAMFTYAIITGINEGWLEKEVYVPVARKAWLSLVSYINNDGDVTEVCVGTNKLNDKTYYYNRPRIAGDFHGQAPYLWCVTALLEAGKR